MRYTEELAKGQREVQEKRIRAIVREEIVNALGALGRAAAYENYSTGSEIAERAATVLECVAGEAVKRLTCPHEKYQDWGYGTQPQCARCGEPEPVPVNPFEEDGRG